jgi:hypothetical protein
LRIIEDVPFVVVVDICQLQSTAQVPPHPLWKQAEKVGKFIRMV